MVGRGGTSSSNNAHRRRSPSPFAETKNKSSTTGRSSGNGTTDGKRPGYTGPRGKSPMMGRGGAVTKGPPGVVVGGTTTPTNRSRLRSKSPFGRLLTRSTQRPSESTGAEDSSSSSSSSQNSSAASLLERYNEGSNNRGGAGHSVGSSHTSAANSEVSRHFYSSEGSVEIDVNGCCINHPFVQLQRPKGNGQWRIMSRTCALCVDEAEESERKNTADATNAADAVLAAVGKLSRRMSTLSSAGSSTMDNTSSGGHPLERQHSRLNTSSARKRLMLPVEDAVGMHASMDDLEEEDELGSITPSFLESSDEEEEEEEEDYSTESKTTSSSSSSGEEDEGDEQSVEMQSLSGHSRHAEQKSVVSHRSHRSHRKQPSTMEQGEIPPIEIAVAPDENEGVKRRPATPSRRPSTFTKESDDRPITPAVNMSRVESALKKIKSMDRLNAAASVSESKSAASTAAANKSKTKSAFNKQRPPPPPPPRRQSMISRESNRSLAGNISKPSSPLHVSDNPQPKPEIMNQLPPMMENNVMQQQQQQMQQMQMVHQPQYAMQQQMQPQLQQQPNMLPQMQQQQQMLSQQPQQPQFVQQQPDQFPEIESNPEIAGDKSKEWMKYSTGFDRREQKALVDEKTGKKRMFKGRGPSKQQEERPSARNVKEMPFTDQFGDFGVYTGQVSGDGKPDGNGKMKYENGVFYEGTWTNGCQEHEKAAANYERIRGGFTSWSGKGKSGTKSGMVLPWNARNSDKIDHNEKTNVRGMEWTDLNGDFGRYTGEVNIDRLPHGPGMMKYDFGLIAEGEWVNGVLKENPHDRMISAAASMRSGGTGAMSVGPGGMSVGPGMSIGPGGMSVGGPGFASMGQQQMMGPGMMGGGMPMHGMAQPPMQFNPMMGGGAPNSAAQHAQIAQQNAIMRNSMMAYSAAGSTYGGASTLGGASIYGGGMPPQIPMHQMPMQQMQMQQMPMQQMPMQQMPMHMNMMPPQPQQDPNMPPVSEIKIDI